MLEPIKLGEEWIIPTHIVRVSGCLDSVKSYPEIRVHLSDGSCIQDSWGIEPGEDYHSNIEAATRAAAKFAEEVCDILNN